MTHVFKHCSFKTTDFKPLKHKQQSYLCFCVRGARILFIFCSFIGFERLHKHTSMSQNPRLCMYPHKHGDLDLEGEDNGCGCPGLVWLLVIDRY